ncbi:MAG: metallophosphoesterase [Planctomycetota bacterium]
MKIGVIADTHDRLPTFRRAIELFRRLEVAAIFHAGDFIAPFAAELISPGRLDTPVHACFGNNDGEREGLQRVLPQVIDGPVRVTLADTPIVMGHFIDWLTPEDRAGARVVISGHTHSVVNETRDGVLYLNPGECCGWVNDRCTAALLDLSGPQPAAEIIDIRG